MIPGHYGGLVNGLGAVRLECDESVACLVERGHLDGFRRENGALPLGAEIASTSSHNANRHIRMQVGRHTYSGVRNHKTSQC